MDVVAIEEGNCHLATAVLQRRVRKQCILAVAGRPFSRVSVHALMTHKPQMVVNQIFVCKLC